MRRSIIFKVLILLAGVAAGCSNHIADTNSRVIVGPYPAKNDIDNIKSHGVTKIVSLLDPGIAYEDTLLNREREYCKEAGIAFQNFQMPGDSGAAHSQEYQTGADAAAAFISSDSGKVYFHSYLTSTRTQTVEALLKKKGILVATYILPRRAGAEITYALDSAQAAYQASHFQEAVDLLAPKTDLNRQGQLLLGWSLYHLNRNEDARHRFDSVLRQDSDEVEATIGLGYCDYRDNQLPQADTMFARAINVHPRDPSANAGMGLVRYKEGKLDDARSFLTTSLKSDSINVEAGQLLLKIQRMQRDSGMRATR